jgi:hypothetical protein
MQYPQNASGWALAPGAVILLYGILSLVPTRQVRDVLAAVIFALALGAQITGMYAFREDARLRNNFFWQLGWRAPALASQARLVTDGLPLKYSNEADLTPLLQVLYVGEQSFAAAGEGVPMRFTPPACVWIVDDAGAIGTAQTLDEARLLAWFGTQPRSWCYYFAKANLASQQGEWDKAALYFAEALGIPARPNDPFEYLWVIEAFVRAGKWEAALSTSRDAAELMPPMHGLMCETWAKGLRDATPPAEVSAEIDELMQSLYCGERK